MDYAGDLFAGSITVTIIIIIAAIGASVGLAFIPASMARKKGHNFGLFWLFGFFLFLPAIIVAATMSPAVPHHAQNGYYPGKTANPTTAPETLGTSTVEEKLRMLQKLKDQGFVSEEEYRAKRKDYLDLL
jgi:hypothetical protein